MSTNGSDMPVILSFALTSKEWAAVAASLTAMSEMHRRMCDMAGAEVTEMANFALETGDRFVSMVHDEMHRRAGQ